MAAGIEQAPDPRRQGRLRLLEGLPCRHGPERTRTTARSDFEALSLASAAGEAIDATAHGYVIVWNSATPDEEGLRLLYVSVTSSQPVDLDILRWSFRGVTPGPRTWTLSWFLPDGTTRVTVQALGGLTQPGCIGDCTPQVLEQIARSLHPVDDAQWRAFASATTTTGSAGRCSQGPNGVEVCTDSGSAGSVHGATTTVTGG